MRLMDVGPAHGHGADLEEDFVLADLRHRHLAKLDGQRFERVLHDGRLGGHGAEIVMWTIVRRWLL